MFYCGLTVGTKCTDQYLELAHTRVNMAKVGSWTSHVDWRVAFVRRTRGETCKIKDSNTEVSM